MNLMARLRCLFGDCHDRPDVIESPILQKMRRNVDETVDVRKQVRETGNQLQDMLTGAYRPIYPQHKRDDDAAR